MKVKVDGNSLLGPEYAELADVHRREVCRVEALFKALQAFPEGHVLPPDPRFVDYLRAQAAKEGGSEDDALRPICHGHLRERGFVPYLFTRNEFARNLAVRQGRITRDQALVIMEQNWSTALYTFLANGYDGVVVDPATEHEVDLSREDLSRLVSLFTISAFAEFEELAIMKDSAGKPVHDGPDGMSLFLYDCDIDSPAVQRAISKAIPSKDPVALVVAPSESILDEVLESDASGVVVNRGLTDERFYRRTEVQKIRQLKRKAPIRLAD